MPADLGKCADADSEVDIIELFTFDEIRKAFCEDELQGAGVDEQENAMASIRTQRRSGSRTTGMHKILH